MIVFSFTFRFLMKFELLLFMVYRKCPTLFFYMCMPSFSNIYLRRLFFLHWIILEPLSKIIWHIYGGLFLDFLLYFMFTCVFGTVSHCFAYCCFLIIFEIRKCEPSTLFLFWTLFWLFSVFWDCICILVWIFCFCKNAIGILIGIVLHL